VLGCRATGGHSPCWAAEPQEAIARAGLQSQGDRKTINDKCESSVRSNLSGTKFEWYQFEWYQIEWYHSEWYQI
jgi:hypothetical protein